MNLYTLRLRVQRTVGLAANSSTEEQTLVDGWANEAAIQWLRRTKGVKRTASLSLSAGQGDYTLDDDVLAFEDPYIDPADGSQEFMLENVDSYDIRQMRRLTTSVTGPPHFYAFEANTLMIYPNPAAGDTLHIVFVPKPTASLSATGDSWSDATRGDIPEEFHPTPEAYVKWKAAEYSNDTPSQMGERFKQQWEQGVVEDKIHLSRRAGVKQSRARVGAKAMDRWRYAQPGVDRGY